MLEKQVGIQLHTEIEDQGQMETNTSQAKGNFYRRNNIDVITFDEKLEGGGAIKSFITIHPDKVNIKRTGVVSMNQQFRINQLTENVYIHPHGNFHMETFTKSMDYQALGENEEGLLTLLYTVKLNGQTERNHKLTLTITKEEDIK